MPKDKRGWLIPQNIAPKKNRCVVLYIPDDIGHIANFWGGLHELALWYNYERDDNKSGAKVAKVWRVVIEDAWRRFINGECCDSGNDGDGDDSGNGGGIPDGSAASQIGRLGYTLEQLEDYIMGWSLRGQLSWVNGKLCYWSEGCCDWVEIPVLSGLTPAPIQKPEGMSLEEWEEGGYPELPNYPPLPNDNPAYITEDSIRCAKAAGIISVLREHIDDIRLVIVGISGAGGFTSGAVLTAVLAGLAFPYVVAISLTSAMIAAFTGYGVAGILDKYTEWTNATDLWDELKCVLPGAITPGETVNDMDVKQGFYYFRQVFGIEVPVSGTTADSMALAILKTIPAMYWKSKYQGAYAEAECECDEYKPYEPPSPPEVEPDVDWYDHFGLSSKTGTGSQWVWAAQTGTAEAADTTASSAIEFTKSFPVVASQPKVAKTGKSLFIEILTRGGTVVGSLPPQEGGINVSFEFGNEDGGGSSTLYASSFYNTVGLVEIPLDPIFDGWGGDFDNIALRSISAKFQYWMDSGESVIIGLGRIEIADSTA